MDNKRHNSDANVPQGEEPRGDLGEKGKTWTPGQEQGISNRAGDEDADEAFVADEEEEDGPNAG